VTPRQIIEEVARAVDKLRLPHSVHIHANNLGMPGNWRTTLETMKALGDSRGHLSHIQFHSYGGGEADENTFNSKVVELAEYVDAHPNLTVDVGQVMFGETTTMTADGPLGYYLSNSFGGKWFSSDTEMESGCGITPIEYKNTSLVHSLQWAIGLEWYLLAKDPWRVVMSTDHPNGGSFLAYPEIVQLLMDRTFREETLKHVHPAVLERSTLKDLTREYSLYEICIITRSGPARILGLANKGHLGPGADADITIYTPNDDKRVMFELPRLVIKSGVVIVDQGEVREPANGKLLYVAPEWDVSIETDLAAWFEKYYSVRFRNYPIPLDYLHEPEEVACKR
jgi:formylmethanofuran dehydrogenase subunit A